MFDRFSGHNQDVHGIVIFSLDSPMNNEGQVNVRWPNYAIDGLCSRFQSSRFITLAVMNAIYAIAYVEA